MPWLPNVGWAKVRLPKGTTDPQIHSRLKEKYVVKFRNEPARATKEQSKMAANRDCQQEGQKDQEADWQGEACLTRSRPGRERARVYCIVESLHTQRQLNPLGRVEVETEGKRQREESEQWKRCLWPRQSLYPSSTCPWVHRAGRSVVPQRVDLS